MTVLPSECPLVSAEDCSPPFLGGQSLLKCLASIMSDDDNDNDNNDDDDDDDDDDDINDDEVNTFNKKGEKKYSRKEEKVENEVAENFDYIIWFNFFQTTIWKKCQI